MDSTPQSENWSREATSARGTVNIQPSLRENRVRSSSKSTLTIQSPTVADTIPIIVMNDVPNSLVWKNPGVRTVKEEISWLERIQYSPDPIKRRLAPGGIRDSATITPQAVFSALLVFTATATSVAFVARALSRRIPMDDRNELTRVVSPATG